MELKKLNWTTFFLSIFFVGFVVMFIIIMTEYPWRERIWALRYRDSVPANWGFTLRDVEIKGIWFPDSKISCKCIASLKPEGKAGRAGFKVGDIPLILVPDIGAVAQEGQFYWILVNSNQRKNPTINVINIAEIDENWYKKIRVLSLEIETKDKKGLTK